MSINRYSFYSKIYDHDADSDVEFEVHIINSDFHIAVFPESGGDCIFNTLDGSTQQRLIDEAYEHFTSYHKD